MSAAVGVYTDYGRAEEVCVNKLGVNTWATCNKDYRESGNVRLRILRYDGDTGKLTSPRPGPAGSRSTASTDHPAEGEPGRAPLAPIGLRSARRTRKTGPASAGPVL
ncbi:hypothetical protein SBADM41S_09116 [Streptomyces badius]